jgi:predicted Zn-dependent protease
MARVHMQQAITLRTEGLMEASKQSLSLAADAYQASIASDPQVAGLFRSGADAAQMAGRPNLAMQWYRRAAELDPSDPRVPLRLAQVVFESDPARARRLLGDVLALDASIPEAHASLALLDALAGHADAARAHMKTAVELATDVPALRVVQARMLRVLGEPQRGAEILLALPAVDRAAEPTAAELARCWTEAGRHAAAADAWSDCFQQNAHRTDAWQFALHAAESAMLAGDEPRAAGLLRQAALLSAPPERMEAIRAIAAEGR